MTSITEALEPEVRAARAALSDHEQMRDAEKGCVPCKLCGGSAVITDAGPGSGYYVNCGNSQSFHPSKGCLIDERRLGGWAYNVMDWWNRLHSARAVLATLQPAAHVSGYASREPNPPYLHVQFSDDGRHIRKWSFQPFIGCTVYGRTPEEEDPNGYAAVSQPVTNTADVEGWQPIETAPENTAIQIWVPGADYYGNDGVYAGMLVNMGTGRRWMTFRWAMGRDLGPENTPAKWRPLPRAPSASVGEEADRG